MFLVPLLFLLFIIWLFFSLINPNTNHLHHYHQNTPSAKPMEILKERYAKGEISEEEYLKIKRNLE